MDCYIVRIYGREERDYRVVAGLMETVGMGEKRFGVPWELWKILCFKKGRKSVKIGPETQACQSIGNSGRGPW